MTHGTTPHSPMMIIGIDNLQQVEWPAFLLAPGWHLFHASDSGGPMGGQVQHRGCRTSMTWLGKDTHCTWMSKRIVSVHILLLDGLLY